MVFIRSLFFFPERVALAGVAIWLALFVIAPVKLAAEVSYGAFGYIALCYAGFLLGCVLFRGTRAQSARFGRSTFWWTAILGSAGLMLRSYDRLFIRGVSLADTALDARAALAGQGAGLLAAAGAALYPFAYIPLILWWARTPDMRLGRVHQWAAAALFLAPLVDALMLLSRSTTITASLMIYIACACALYGGRPLPARLLKFGLLGMLVVGGLSAYLFQARLDAMQMDLVYSILESAYGYLLRPDQGILYTLDQHGWAGNTLRAILPILQYYLHGVFEFGVLWEQPQQTFSYGVQHFEPYLKFFSVIGLADNRIDLSEIYPRLGIFTGFFGAVWTDFGWIGPVMMLLFGIGCAKAAKAARNGVVYALPLHAYLSVVVLLMPVANFLITAQGMYVINTFLVVWLVEALRSSRARRIQAQHRALIGPNL